MADIDLKCSFCQSQVQESEVEQPEGIESRFSKVLDNRQKIKSQWYYASTRSLVLKTKSSGNVEDLVSAYRIGFEQAENRLTDEEKEEDDEEGEDEDRETL